MIPALPLDVAQQEEMPHGEGRRSQVAATHDERERPGHRHDEHDGHDRHDGHDAGEQGGRRAARRLWPTREALVGRRYLITIACSPGQFAVAF